MPTPIKRIRTQRPFAVTRYHIGRITRWCSHKVLVWGEGIAVMHGWLTRSDVTTEEIQWRLDRLAEEVWHEIHIDE